MKEILNGLRLWATLLTDDLANLEDQRDKETDPVRHAWLKGMIKIKTDTIASIRYLVDNVDKSGVVNNPATWHD